MPSTRMLADQFSVSRITVLLTYERLTAERYLRTEPANGTVVRRAATTKTKAAETKPIRAGGASADAEPFAGRPDARLFPALRWRAVMRTALDHLGASLTADHLDGDPALRRAIARWLSTSRGLAVEADQIILATGRQHALHTVAYMLLRPGVRVVLESPRDHRSEPLIASTGATIVRVPVDDAGLQTALLPDGPVAMTLATPEHQRPLGSVMSHPRREALLACAERAGAIVIAEDIDGELRCEGFDAAPLMSLDQHGRVIRLGGFALSLGPGVQLAYLAVPRRMIAAARTASRLTDDHSGQLEASALAGLLDSGAYARHLHHLRKVYLSRRDTLIDALRAQFGAGIRITGETGGLHLAWHVPSHLGHARAVSSLARRQGLDATPIGDAIVLIGFGARAEPQIETGICGLALALARSAETFAKPAVRQISPGPSVFRTAGKTLGPAIIKIPIAGTTQASHRREILSTKNRANPRQASGCSTLPIGKGTVSG